MHASSYDIEMRFVVRAALALLIVTSCILGSSAFEFAFENEAELFGVVVVDNIKHVDTLEECALLCHYHEDCLSAVYRPGEPACKLLSYSHLETGVLAESAGRVYVVPNAHNGCQEKDATNYDSTALLRGPCEFPEGILGCMNETAVNYDESATVHVESMCHHRQHYTHWEGHLLLFETRIGGPFRVDNIGECMDVCDEFPGCKSFNFRANGQSPKCHLFGKIYGEAYHRLANDTDYIHGSLGYEGCTNPLATNYAHWAAFDNDNCTYDENDVTLGCHEPLAANYDPLTDVHDADRCDFYGDWSQKYDVLYSRHPLLERVTRPAMYYVSTPFWCRDRCEDTPSCVAFSFLTTHYCFLYSHFKLGNDSEGWDGFMDYPRMEFWYRENYFGCTMTEALNYDPDSRILDINECTFPDDVTYGCLNINATNFNTDAVINHDSFCDFHGDFVGFKGERYVRTDTAIKYKRPNLGGVYEFHYCRQKCENYTGCVGFNFLENGLCHLFTEIDISIDERGWNGTIPLLDWEFYYSSSIFGCMNELASNYKSTAVHDDGSCEYEASLKLGCNETLASNHDATVDVHLNSLCEYGGDFVKYVDAKYTATEVIERYSRPEMNEIDSPGWCRVKCEDNESCVAFNFRPNRSCMLFDEVEIFTDDYGVHGLIEREEWLYYVVPPLAPSLHP